MNEYESKCGTEGDRMELTEGCCAKSKRNESGVSNPHA